MRITGSVEKVAFSVGLKLGNDDELLTRECLSLTILGVEHERFELKTGELFAAPWRFRTEQQEAQRIDFHVRLYPQSSPEESNFNKLQYYPSLEMDFETNDSVLEASVFLEAKLFAQLVERASSSLSLERLSLALDWEIGDHDFPIAYGHAPDGSELVWNNLSKENQAVPVKSIELHYQSIRPKLSATKEGESDAKLDLTAVLKTVEVRLNLIVFLLSIIAGTAFWIRFLAPN